MNGIQFYDLHFYDFFCGIPFLLNWDKMQKWAPQGKYPSSRYKYHSFYMEAEGGGGDEGASCKVDESFMEHANTIKIDWEREKKAGSSHLMMIANRFALFCLHRSENTNAKASAKWIFTFLSQSKSRSNLSRRTGFFRWIELTDWSTAAPPINAISTWSELSISKASAECVRVCVQSVGV